MNGMKRSHLITLILMALALSVLFSIEPVSAQATDDVRAVQLVTQMAPIHAPGRRIGALGAFSCDFELDLTKLTEPLGATIERDRIFLQKETRANTWPKTPGMIQKHIPVTPTGPTTLHAGGRYLFEGRAQAAVYSSYINRSFTYPGTTQFLHRPEFSSPECRDWTVITAWNFASIDTHTALRTERFDSGRTTLTAELALTAELVRLAPQIVSEAAARGYAEVQILQSIRDHKVQLVYFISRLSGPDPFVPDVAAIGKISADPPLGALLASTSISRVFDLSSFVLTVWLPFKAGDHGAASLWPNTPPIGGPECGDHVCTPSRDETGATCAVDCTPTCGDAVCQAGEDLARCPSDCGHPFY
jgi:hypothetical protein